MRDPVTRFVALSLLTVLAGASPALAAPGELDPSYAGGGFVTLPGGGLQPGRDGAVLSRGRVLVLSGSSVRRLTSKGRIDRAFKSGTAAGRGDAWGFVTRSGEGSLVGVRSGSVLKVRAVRGDGRPDRTFSRDGLMELPGVRPDARLLKARGNAAYVLDGTALRRITRGGSLDGVFGYKPLAVPDGRLLQRVSTAASAPDGRLFVAGEIAPGESVLLRLLPDGSFDPTFGADGVTGLPFLPTVLGVQRGAGIVHALAVDDDGRGVGVRVVANGIVDPAWRAGGAEPLWTDGAIVTDAFVDGANRLVVSRTSTDSRPGLLRLDDEGKPDATFGDQGSLDLPGGTRGAVVHRVLRAPNNRLVALGSSGQSGEIAVWRIDA